MKNTWTTAYEALPAELVRLAGEHEHGGSDLGGIAQFVHTENAIKATRFGLEFAICEALELELPCIGRILTPPAHAALIDAERLPCCCLGAVVLYYVRGLHGR